MYTFIKITLLIQIAFSVGSYNYRYSHEGRQQHKMYQLHLKQLEVGTAFGNIEKGDYSREDDN
ncbi:hypothetical protein Ahy_A07g031254 isoform C [Arachis hypogaea]|uniref:Uncharacterized protein n=1 Tax=Arachis hypogaea TaxID=3818 RepID=A0A445C3D5_ARAHY|nr:hypothetical protein Ahy_A07g031254 isoform C [Arachis hypogaea]